MSVNNNFIIGLDVDGVIADLISPIISLNNEYYELKHPLIKKLLTENDITCYMLESIIGLEAYNFLWRKAEDLQLVKSFKMYNGAKEGVERLRSLGKVVFVTAPSFMYRNWQIERYEWLKENFEFFTENDLMSVTDKSLFSGNILIDDSSFNLRNWTEKTNKKSIKVNRSWNQDLVNHPYTAYSWDDIVSLTKTIINESK